MVSLFDCEILKEGSDAQEDFTVEGFGSGVSQPTAKVLTRIRRKDRRSSGNIPRTVWGGGQWRGEDRASLYYIYSLSSALVCKAFYMAAYGCYTCARTSTKLFWEFWGEGRPAIYLSLLYSCIGQSKINTLGPFPKRIHIAICVEAFYTLANLIYYRNTVTVPIGTALN